ncbi:hypothetical protein GCM10022243_42590 [Saccharothrix violaceirubra]|uniref:Uncharacterized protein n=1 Tax=Saccharothrix violaceirubra TaxID=413306 RepID=A0A7W7T2U9_9PSEU|nr:hypothetical protein [Saccharothrix violaceirubra]MBB4965548.1 hypothetical protein [Saccharothrix violaceirubra]
MIPEIEATVIATVVRALPQVAGPHSGRYGEIATHLPGRRVAGVRVGPAGITVGVVVRYPATTAEVAAAVRAAVGRPASPLHVWIGDIAFPDTHLPVVPPSDAAARHAPARPGALPRRAPATTTRTTP